MNVKKITKISILVALGVIFSFVDKYISFLIFPSIPGVKIGIANIIILIVLNNYGFKESLIIALLKSLISGLLLSGLTSYIIGGSATLVSFLIMYIVMRVFKEKISLIGISSIGGFVHTLTQLLVIMLIYKMENDVFLYGTYLFIISLFSSVLIGLLSIKINTIYIKI